MRLLFLAIPAFIYSTFSFAQINITVEIKGITGELAENVRLYLSIEQQKDHALFSEGRMRRLHNKAPQEIASALQPYGYYRPEIKKELTRVQPDHWLAAYNINLGPPILIGDFNFVLSKEAGEDPEFQALTQNITLRKGDIFNHLTYEKLKTDLARLASERGYFNARFIKHKVEINLDTYEVLIHLHFDAGLRYRFGEVLLEQNVLEAEFLRRYIPFEQGAPYTLYDLIELQQALNDSDYFRTVEVSPGQPQSDSTEIPITIKLTPRKRNRYSFGLGYGTNTGARTKFGWGISPLNQQGHRLDNEVKISQSGYNLNSIYRVPILNPRIDQLTYKVGIINEKTDSSDSTVHTIGASINRSRGSWRETVSLNYQQEEFVVAGDRGTSNLLIPGVNWSRSWGRNIIYTIDGFRFDISLRGASKDLLSETDFFQLQSGIKSISSIGKHNRIIAHGRLGSTWTQEFNQLPSSVRFFAGGAQSVRGYAYQSLGPVDNTGLVVGGKHLMVGSIELEHSFNNKWGAAIFYDAGNALDDFADKLERGAGFGIRWKSPVGPIRIDLARALSRGGTPWRLHINIGADL